MAENFVIFFADKLTTLIANEAKLLGGVEQQLVLLSNQFKLSKSFLRDVDENRRNSASLEEWVTQLREVVYDAEDVIDAYMFLVERQRTMTFVRRIFDSWNRWKAVHKTGKQIEEINSRAQRILASRSDFNIEVGETSHGSNAVIMPWVRRSVPTAEDIDVVGFKNESAQLINLLMEDVSQCSVISILGMGGLGKTAVAQMVYKNPEVRNSFNVQVWISVSQEYQVKDILLKALKQVSGDSSSLESDEEMKEQLRQQLQNKKYLVILDDIWTAEAWERLSGVFPKNSKGSRVILTTRIKEVARYANPSSSHHLDLRLLDESESIELLCRKVFSKPADACPADLVLLGKEIVNKCGRLPLAIVVTGGLLMGKERTRDAWSKVLQSVNWHLNQDSNQCRQILILSFSDLPYYLKPCFLYLGLFPEDHTINADRLIRLWVAEGFAQPRGLLKMEDVAEDFLEELAQRSLIQVTSRQYHGGPVDNFQVHDLVRDLAISEGVKDRFINIFTNDTSPSSSKPRRLTIQSRMTNAGEEFFTYNAQSLRSLLLFTPVPFRKFPDGIKMLRVLDLELVVLEHLGVPIEIGKLILLRYLNLSGTRLKILPRLVGLVNLQTLDIRNTFIEFLPKWIFKLKSSRHLFLGNQTHRIAEGFIDVETFGKNILSLSLSSGLWMDNTDTEKGLADVIVKQGCPRSLDVWGKLAVNNDRRNLNKCFPSSLTELILFDTEISQDPSDVLGSLPTLKSLYLLPGSYVGEVIVFYEGAFPQLQFLYLSRLQCFEWRVENGAMPTLVHVGLRLLENLKRLSNGLRNITTLQRIEISKMPLMENRIKEGGEDWDIIKHVPFIDYKYY